MVIEGLYIYPIKSLPPIAVSSINGGPSGLENDRIFILLDEKGRMMTQRNTDRMNLFDIFLSNDGIVVHSVILERTLVLKFNLMGGEVRTFNVWDRTVRGSVYSGIANVFFSQHFNQPVTCIAVVPADDGLTYHDSSPILLANHTTLRNIALIMNRPIDIMRFRPNIIVSAGLSMAEFDWHTISINKVSFDAIKMCSRCVIINRNPLTDERDQKLLTDLKPFLMKENKLKYGLYLQPKANYTISIGDEVLAE